MSEPVVYEEARTTDPPAPTEAEVQVVLDDVRNAVFGSVTVMYDAIEVLDGPLWRTTVSGVDPDPDEAVMGLLPDETHTHVLVALATLADVADQARDDIRRLIVACRRSQVRLSVGDLGHASGLAEETVSRWQQEGACRPTGELPG